MCKVTLKENPVETQHTRPPFGCWSCERPLLNTPQYRAPGRRAGAIVNCIFAETVWPQWSQVPVGREHCGLRATLLQLAASGPLGQPVSAQMLTHICTVSHSLPGSLPNRRSSYKLLVRSMSSERVRDPHRVTQPGLSDSGSLPLLLCAALGRPALEGHRA